MTTGQNQEKVTHLTISNYWQELEQLRRDGSMPASFVDCLKSLVSSHINSTIGPEATPHRIGQAKEYMLGGILLSSSDMDRLYDVVVFIPNDCSSPINRSFFTLVRKWNGGEVRYLKSFKSL